MYTTDLVTFYLFNGSTILNCITSAFISSHAIGLVLGGQAVL